MKYLRIAALAAMGLGACPALAQTVCPVQAGACAFSITGPAKLTVGAQTGFGLRYQRITAGTTTDLWCTRVPGVTPALNGAGSFRVPAGSYEEFPIAGTGVVPQLPTYCAPASGTATGSAEVY